MSSKRKPISKKNRFEVFKRDSFTCQYCGSVAPNVILELDHIHPVSKGGANDIMNLITSCNDCNRGKTNIELCDNSVVLKQRVQLELLQERREQIESMFAWRSELSGIEKKTSDMVIDYVEKKFDNYIITESGKRSMNDLLKKFDLPDILDAIDLSAAKYLKYDNNDTMTKESVEDFLSKIGGILFNNRKSPTDRKLSYVKGICKNRFSYWDAKRGSIILNQYISALRDRGWGEERILILIDEHIIPGTKYCDSWTEWNDMLAMLIAGEESKDKEVDEEDVLGSQNPKEFADDLFNEINGVIPSLEYIGKPFKGFSSEDLVHIVNSIVVNYLMDLCEHFEVNASNRKELPTHYKSQRKGFNDMFKPVDSMLTFHLQNAADELLRVGLSSIEENIGCNKYSEFYADVCGEYIKLSGMSVK